MFHLKRFLLWLLGVMDLAHTKYIVHRYNGTFHCETDDLNEAWNAMHQFNGYADMLVKGLVVKRLRLK